jgi:hypothetical protein
LARLLARRLKIISSANLKLIISALTLILLLPSFKSFSLVAPTRHTALNLACLLEVGQQAWCRKKRDRNGNRERMKMEVPCPAQTQDYCNTFNLIDKRNGAEANYNLRGKSRLHI